MKIVKSLALILCTIGFLLFSGQLLDHLQEYDRGQQEYESIRNGFLTPETDNISINQLNPATKINEENLKKTNPDYIFWLTIPDTSIDYPVVQSSREGYYLNHTFLRSQNSCGALFIQEGDKGLVHENTIIFGHNRKDGTMFGQLKQYRNPEFYSEHSQIQIFIEGRWYQGKIFSCQIWNENDEKVYQKNFGTSEERQAYLRAVKDKELYPTGVFPKEGQSLITLSTCYGTSQRMIVQAVVMCYTE